MSFDYPSVAPKRRKGMAEYRFETLSIPRSVYEGMLWHALAEQPLECCGLLAGVVRDDGVGEVRLRYPLLNAAASPVEFESEPRIRHRSRYPAARIWSAAGAPTWSTSSYR
jgi:hypothetical protein